MRYDERTLRYVIRRLEAFANTHSETPEKCIPGSRMTYGEAKAADALRAAAAVFKARIRRA